MYSMALVKTNQSYKHCVKEATEPQPLAHGTLNRPWAVTAVFRLRRDFNCPYLNINNVSIKVNHLRHGNETCLTTIKRYFQPIVCSGRWKVVFL